VGSETIARGRSKAAIKANREQSTEVNIRFEDLRFKRLRRRTGTLFIFIVDASGSMLVNRMAQAKGALIGLLQRAYLHRDSVALVSLRGDEARVLLAPTRSVEVARRLVDRMPGGGGTPIAKGLVCALEVARQARRRQSCNALLVLFTDGRANIGLRSVHEIEPAARGALIEDELKQIGAVLRAEGVRAVVVDTKSRFIASGEARELAETLGAGYCYLPLRQSKAISEAISAAAWNREAGN
jgi:magnesium chelatase subunit D